MTRPSEALVEEIARVIVEAEIAETGLQNADPAERQREVTYLARAVLASPPVRKLVEALELAVVDLKAANVALSRPVDLVSLTIASAALAPFLEAKETV